jgi:hypothetical protein
MTVRLTIRLPQLQEYRPDIHFVAGSVDSTANLSNVIKKVSVPTRFGYEFRVRPVRCLITVVTELSRHPHQAAYVKFRLFLIHLTRYTTNSRFESTNQIAHQEANIRSHKSEDVI